MSGRRTTTSSGGVSGLTPVLRQYLELKQKHPDAILFFRMGDFYEMFFEDAEVASGVLDIALTSRDKNAQEKVPLCGVPHHSADSYISQLVSKGFKVAVCEQMEDPKKAKGLVKRDITRVITASTVTEPGMLRPDSTPYLVSLVRAGGRWGFCRVDFLSGRMSVMEFSSADEVLAELARCEPAEIVLSSSGSFEEILPDIKREFEGIAIETVEFSESGASVVCDRFGLSSPAAAGLDGLPLGLDAAGIAIEHLERHRQSVSHLRVPTPAAAGDSMYLDASTCRNLELVKNSDGGVEWTLYGVLDFCLTAQGRRRLKEWILYPLVSRRRIMLRQSMVADMVEHRDFLEKVRDVLDGVADLERLCGRISLGRVSPRELVHLRESLKRCVPVGSWLSARGLEAFDFMSRSFGDFSGLIELLDRAIEDDPPSVVGGGGVFKRGYDEKLDELTGIAGGGREWLLKYEARERERTGINTLKVRYNKVFGYFIEVTKANLDRIPSDYRRRQTLVNAERFVTDELQEYETKILSAEEDLKKREVELFDGLLADVKVWLDKIKVLASAVADLDAVASLAHAAVRFDYTRPEILEEGDRLIEIEDGRHPVVERAGGERFVPNSIRLDGDENQVLLITGPNMAGKSTVIRQVALIALMAQMGSFVPASRARIAPVDRIFTRVGASDRLSRGQSTFMVEMTEASVILRQATERSLVMLDELGRGTSTYDGLSIAWAVAEYLHNKVGALTLFATHYHELTDLARELPRVKNFNIAVKEWGGKILFLRKLVRGAASRSYGIEVARLAGVPEEVLLRAGEILSNLESGELDEAGRPRIARGASSDEKSVDSGQMDLFSRVEAKIVSDLSSLNPDELTPIQALQLLSEWKKMLKK